jgi:hypothetical protein
MVSTSASLHPPHPSAVRTSSDLTQHFILIPDTCKLAGTSVTGGQTVYNPWPIIGGVAKTICKKQDIIM